MFRISILLLILSTFHISRAQNIIYVNIHASGNQTGASWADAFSHVNDAFLAAEYGDEIWVAQGRYTPTVTGDRTASFQLKNGVKLYGGFVGNETLLEQRDFQAHPTVLSGEIGDSTVLTDNCYTVVRGEGLDSTTVLDGFFIRDGYSYGPNLGTTPETGAGMLLKGSPSLNNSQPLITNCTFENNRANYGGAMALIGVEAGNVAAVNPRLINCRFNQNKALIRGGGIYKIGPSPGAPVQVKNCILTENRAAFDLGGGFYIEQATNTTIHFTNCIFDRDSAFSGGGIFIEPSRIVGSSLAVTIDSCMFDGNFGFDAGGLIYNGGLVFADSLKINFTIQNTTFKNNIAYSENGSAYLIFAGNKSILNANILNCRFEGNKTAGYHLTWFWINSGSKAIINYDRCYFNNNFNATFAAAACFPILLNNGLSELHPNTIISKISNCVFDHNGGGVIVLSLPENYTDVDIVNCTFHNNFSPVFVRNDWEVTTGDYRFDYRIRNSIIWEFSDIYSIFYNNDPLNQNISDFDVDYSNIRIPEPQQGPPGWEQAFGAHMRYWEEPMFVDSAAGDFRLLPCSPLVNAGNNDIVEDLGLQQDFNGFDRIQYQTVDLGAYETPDSCGSVSATEAAISVGQKLLLWNNPSADGSVAFPCPVGSNSESAHFAIFDVKGRLQLQTFLMLQERNAVNITSVPAGFYWVQLETSKGRWMGKLVVL